MKLISLRKNTYIRNAPFLVDAVVNNNSAIQYASVIEYYISSLAENAKMLYCLKANTPALSWNEPEDLGFERYDDRRYIKTVEKLFLFEGENCDDNHLNDQDYMDIVNYMYPYQYDKCIIIKSNMVLKYFRQEGTERDLIEWTEFYKYSYKVIVHKGVMLDESKEYSLDELISLVQSKDILIVTCYSSLTFDSEDYKVAVTRCARRFNELKPKEWLENVKKKDNPVHSGYIELLKQLITEELINECLIAYSRGCKRLLEYPEDKFIRFVLKDSKVTDAKVFEGMNESQRLRFVKKYEKSHDLINKAREIITKYSDAYRMYLALVSR